MDLQGYYQNRDVSVSWIGSRISIKPKIMVVLSGGLSAFADCLDNREVILSPQVPNFPRSRAEGHDGKIYFGTYKKIPLAVFSGRFHFYEGHSPQMIVFPHFVMAKLGCEILVTTNAVGGIKKTFRPGDIVAITDHINMMGINPLIGLAFLESSNQFTNMTQAYDTDLLVLAKRVAKRLKIVLKTGVYVATSGPSYETKAEIAAFRKVGADCVGMSTVPEVIAANYLNMRVLALSGIANPAADLHKGRMSHAEVLAAMTSLAPKMVKLLKGVISEINQCQVLKYLSLYKDSNT